MIFQSTFPVLVDGFLFSVAVNGHYAYIIHRDAVGRYFYSKCRGMQRSMACLCIVIFLTVLSCEPETPPQLQLRPVAIAGKDRAVALSDGFRFYVDGNQSYNPAQPNNRSSGLSMNWRQLSGPELVDFIDNGSKAHFIPGIYGAYSFELTVRNENGEHKDSITVTVVPGSCNQNLEYVKAEFREESVYNKTIYKDAGVCVASGRLIMAGGDEFNGSDELHIYDMAAKSWKTAVLPLARTIASIGANKDFAFITGQKVASDLVDIYEFSTGKISTVKLSLPRVGVSIAVMGNKAVFAGGLDSEGNIVDVIDIYELDSKTWSTSKMVNPRYGMVASVVGNKIYFSGGYTSEWYRTNRLDVYDVVSGQWGTHWMSKEWGDHSAAVMGGSKLVFTSGYRVMGGGPPNLRDMEWFDLPTSTFKRECLFGDNSIDLPTTYASGLASVFVGQNLYSCYNQFLTRFDVGANKWIISKGMKDHDLAGFFSDGNRLLAISITSSGTRNKDRISIYEVKF